MGIIMCRGFVLSFLKIISNPSVIVPLLYLSLLVFSLPQNRVTPLRVASQNGHDEVVTLLVKSGAKQTPGKVSEIQNYSHTAGWLPT